MNLIYINKASDELFIYVTDHMIAENQASLSANIKENYLPSHAVATKSSLKLLANYVESGDKPELIELANKLIKDYDINELDQFVPKKIPENGTISSYSITFQFDTKSDNNLKIEIKEEKITYSNGEKSEPIKTSRTYEIKNKN